MHDDLHTVLVHGPSAKIPNDHLEVIVILHAKFGPDPPKLWPCIRNTGRYTDNFASIYYKMCTKIPIPFSRLYSFYR